MNTQRRGSALIVTLVLVLLLTAATAAAARGARSSGLVASNQQAQAVARAMAESGVLAARHRLESAMRAAPDSQARMQIFDGLEGPSTSVAAPLPFVADTLGDGVFATAVVNASARLDVNAAGFEGLSRLFRTVASPSDADRVASLIASRVSGSMANAAQRARAERMQSQDSLVDALLGRTQGPSARRSGILPFESLDEVDGFVGGEAPWLSTLAPLLTVDGDGSVDRRHAPQTVLAAAAGSLVDAPTRIVFVARGWMSGHALTREIQAVYAVEGAELHLVRWRERDR
ncbi:MAG: general secretion pathway protein GspK [Gemmatimonadaceae bacterium]|nr:general secretion pathway protein GspK [Gemmatimonadaceae bacterium]